MATPIQVNPAAILKSIEERYNWGVATGVHDSAYYTALINESNMWAARWAQDASVPGTDATAANNLMFFKSSAENLTQRLDTQVKTEGLYNSTKQNAISGGGGDKDALMKELADAVDAGTPVSDVVAIMMASGRFEVDDVSWVAQLWMNTDGTFANGKTPKESGLDIPGPGFGGGAGGKRIAPDITNPQLEWEKGLAQFNRGLSTDSAGGGKSPQVAAMNARSNDLFQQYLGEMEVRKSRGEEPANLWKEDYVTHPGADANSVDQYGNPTGGKTLQTVRPSISVTDWLTKNVDPISLMGETPQGELPGERGSTGGFRGYVKKMG
jgi:hypothetical protein